MKHTVLTLRFSILSIFISLFVFAMLIVVGITYYRFSGSISYVALSLMRQASSQVYDDIADELRDVELESQFSAHLIGGGTLDHRHQQELIDYTHGVMSVEAGTLPSVQSVFWGDETGSFISSEKADDNSISSEVINRMLAVPTREILYRNLQGRIIKRVKSSDLTYDPRLRPWYNEAKKAGKLIWTDVLPLRVTGYLGLTAAMPVLNENGKFQGVFAMNMRLDYLRHFIENLKISEHGVAFIINSRGKVLAYPRLPQYQNKELMDVQSLPTPWVIESYLQYQKTKKQEFIFRFAGEDYLAVYLTVPFIRHGWLIGVVAPENDFIGRLVKTNLITISIAFIILLLGIFLMSTLVNRIVNPIKKLVHETERIKNFDLVGKKPIYSRIKEIILLADAIYSMKKGLRSFQKYVPATLVRQLIEAHHDVFVGGDRKQLAIFFSDIQDFTEIIEDMDPDYLLEHLCDYFNELSHIIMQKNGTIDKYIGDSIMAFWGAPLPEEKSCHLAAMTALECSRRVSALNKEWAEKGIPTFHTRIGLHYGEAVVGNLGSEERLNYTAIGDAINITSRLEGVNKIYGTKIIVSDAVYQAIKNDFVLRYIDCIAVKGKKNGINIYELIGEEKTEVTYDIDAYQLVYREAYAYYQQQQWQEAIVIFNKCLQIYAEDSLAPSMIKRCQDFMVNSPGSDWDGVWRVREK
jgi:adenylate cyclase